MSDTVHLIVAHYLSDTVSGAEQSIADFVDKVDERFQVTMLTPGEGSLSDYYRFRDFDVWAKRIHTKRRRYPGLHTIQSYLFARDLKDRGFDAILCNTFSAASRVGTACQLAGIPYGIYVREYIPDHPIYRKTLNGTDRIFAVSKDVSNYLGDMTNSSKIVVAYATIDPTPVLNRVASHNANGTRLIPY